MNAGGGRCSRCGKLVAKRHVTFLGVAGFLHDGPAGVCGPVNVPTSKNPGAATIMGYRGSGIPIDLPCELGYWCPVCRVPPLTDGRYDQRLYWSEYNGFLWCEVCDRDYPSAFCVPLNGTAADNTRPAWVNCGMEDAISVFLATVAAARVGQETT